MSLPSGDRSSIEVAAFSKAMAWGRDRHEGPGGGWGNRDNGGWGNRDNGGTRNRDNGGLSDRDNGGGNRDNGGSSGRDNGSSGNRDGGGGDDRPSPRAGGDDRRNQPPRNGDAQPPNTTTMDFDAERRMLRLGFTFGWGRHEPDRHEIDVGRHHGGEQNDNHWRHDRHQRHHRHEHDDGRHDHDGRHGDRHDWANFHLRHRRHESADYNLREPGVPTIAIPQPAAGPVAAAIVRNVYPTEPQQMPTSPTTLEKALDPVSSRYQEATRPLSPATTMMAGAQITAGTFAPLEVLAVALDPEAIDRVRSLGFKADPAVGTDEVVRLTVPPGLDALRGQELLKHELPGRQFELNRIYRVYRASMSERAGPSVVIPPPGERCAGDRCFAKAAIGWKETLGVCARGLKVGIIDTVIDSGHPAFARRNNIHTFDFVPDGKRTAPDWHGTGVLSVLAANPQAGGAPGLIPDAEFFAASVFFADDDGEMGADTVSILQALGWMRKAGVKIVNMSFAGPNDALVAVEIARMAKTGVLFVAAAGNEGPTAQPAYPAAYPQVIAVTAVTRDLRNYRYANRGDHIDVAAPGVDIWAAVPGGREGYHTGTSFAAPHVAAVLAVEPRDILKREKNVLLDSLPVRELGDLGRNPIYGRGLLLAPNSCGPVNEIASAE
jgi:subtilisin family serine protease